MQHLSLDLHGRTWREALEEFTALYNTALESTVDSGVATITVVHGYGSTGEGGVIRTRLRAFLQRCGDRLEFTAGEDLDDNPGCTVVMPRKTIPDSLDLLAEQIWEYCTTPKSKSKVTRRFRRHGEPKVLQAVKLLESQGRLHKRRGNKIGLFQAS